jgi:hypothetical protein
MKVRKRVSRAIEPLEMYLNAEDWESEVQKGILPWRVTE